MDRDDDDGGGWQGEEDVAEELMLDDILRGQIMRCVEERTATQPSLPAAAAAVSDVGDAPDQGAILIKASQATKGGACLPQLAWTCWTAAFVLDPAVDGLPHKISQGLQLQPSVPLNVLLSHLATVVRQWTAEGGPPNQRMATIRFRQGLILLSLLEIHEALSKTPTSKLAGQRRLCKKALGTAPLCLYDDGVTLKPSEVFVDLDADISPSTRAPPEYLQPFYYLLMTLGAPTVPTDSAPTPQITALWQGILNDHGWRALLLGAQHDSDSPLSLRVRHPLADVQIDFGGQQLYGHALVLASACEVLRHLIFGLGGSGAHPESHTAASAGHTSTGVIALTLCESLEEEVDASTLEALLLYLYTGTVPALGRFGRKAEARQLGLDEHSDGSSVELPVVVVEAAAADAAGAAPPVAQDEAMAAFACQLLRLADHFMLEELRQRCECCLASMVDVMNVCDLLALAHSSNAFQLVKTCNFYIISMRHLVMELESWGRLPDELKRSVL